MFDFRSVPSLKLTAKAPANGWLEDELSFRYGQFSGDMLDFRGAV